MSILVGGNLFNQMLLRFRQVVAKFRMKRKEDILLEELKTVMKQELAKIESDTMATPEELQWIGWEPKAEAQPLDPPGMPRYAP